MMKIKVYGKSKKYSALRTMQTISHFDYKIKENWVKTHEVSHVQFPGELVSTHLKSYSKNSSWEYKNII